MNKRNRFFSMLLIFTMVFSLISALPLNATAAYTPAQQEQIAQALKTLTLFEGYSATDFGLKDIPTREQALVFQIRALGENAAAKAWRGPSPYTDVPANHWSLPYIGYATQMGYTSGIGGGKFGLGQPANAQMMTTFVLRGLGYSDGGASPDFSYSSSLSFGKSKEMLDSDVPPVPFTRGDAVSILFNALTVNVKGTTTSMADGLMSLGVFTQAQLTAALKILQSPPAPAEATTSPKEGTYTVRYNAKQEQVFDISTASTGNGESLIIYKHNGQTNQQFTFTKVGNYYAIKAKHSGKAITVPAGGGKGTKIVQSTYTGSDNQLFEVKTNSKGITNIIAKNGFYLGVSNGGTANGTPIILWTKSTVGSQDFVLKAVPAPVSPTTTEKTIRFVNKTGVTLTAFYASSSAESDWGENLLDSKLANNASVEIIFPIARDDKLFDLRTDYSGGSLEFQAVDFSKISNKSTVYLEIKNGVPQLTQK